jgi:hypothetical protein
MTWVATPPPGWPVPPGFRPPTGSAPYSTGPYSTGPYSTAPYSTAPYSTAPYARPPYYGPPSYPAVPRWGFPRLAWREPTSVPGTPSRPPRSTERVLRYARVSASLLWMVAISALLAAGGEVWRYALLVIGRDTALSADVVAVSDALVDTGAWLALVTGLIALVATLCWLLGIRDVAGTLTGTRSARPDWQVLLGVLVPGLNLVVAGSVLAELEHTAAALTGPRDRPRPSRLVLTWWAAWALSEVLAVVTLLLDLRTGVQARADGVLWYAVTDLAAVVAAVLTVRVVGSITGMVVPASLPGSHRFRVVRVDGAVDGPSRRTRPVTATR